MSKIIEKVQAAGVVGAGGAGFPTHVKLAAKAEIYIVNCAECEPMLRTDQQLAARYPELLLEGLNQAMKATGAREGIIALKAKYKAAIKAIQPLLPPNIRIGILRDIYPAGDEVMTIWLTTGRRVPPGGIPINIGVVVNNVQTVMNIAKAMRGQAVTTKTLTVTGAVKSPATVTVPVGTTLTEVLDLAGGAVCAEAAYIDGGPMMGNLVADLSAPVTKTTGGLIVLPADHLLIRRKQQSVQSVLQIAKTVCEQCCYCTELCPRHIIGHELPPHLIVRSVNHNAVGNPQLLQSALTCSECGVCEAYSCPVGISPMRVNVALKGEFRAHNIRYQGDLRQADPMAEHRLIPSSRLVSRLHLQPWYPPDAPLRQENYQPERVCIPLRQHIGAPAVAVIKEGDLVEAGQLIAEMPADALGARIHASITGTVEQVSPQVITIRKGGATS
ncbi:4Fe-4S dicluster domain-containing protein [Sporomusa acidovorans]|uniref:Ion-translocating oxidoreductase complex subunit C n=1 Tax=Sporomusa acidovorans (strain ATCC 49682 / DSM 3132 / Mol) TaxID=1123286 RepID=A0ABZ3J7X9_SPOA4|nr:4Fe-4S dicluster domain-containing protein [Sporomusa acidovorans]OZC17508.1 electron transport complex subunit RsxC [Sporomusa acidovorans DSM 3132]SDF07929.1 Na+-translocating ferredoxin:NAD+ oxidoreductase RNF, RnfC subunit [Sporomusa acidovorans]